MKKKDENMQFKILYFIGILLIVSGHCDGASVPLFYIWFPDYSFHLALFVFCSGYFFVKNKEKDIGDFIKKLIKKFLIPLYVWNLIYGILITILHHFGIKYGAGLSWRSLVLSPILDGHQFVFNLSSWFIVPLFIIQFINIFMIKTISKKDYYFYIHFVISLLIGFIGIEMAIRGYNQGLYLLVARISYFIPFFSLGMLYKNNLEKYDKLSNVKYFIILFSIDLLMIYSFGKLKAYTPSLANDYDVFYRPFLAGTLGIAFWLRISKILVPILKDSKIVMTISNNTFAIMMHHLAGFFVLNSFCFLINKYIIHLKEFNTEQFTQSIWYRYLPKHIENFNIIYAIFGIVFSLTIYKISKYVKSLPKRYLK